jgi:hypothetical protein
MIQTHLTHTATIQFESTANITDNLYVLCTYLLSVVYTVVAAVSLHVPNLTHHPNLTEPFNLHP